ncbi:hypothetical protein CHS0354_036490 [Potamilus streckersoni]|uniref:Uncharacterized protein n=1 Tax=Potamilus streckersoni TaxID=2493646 RepID=A0AAE0VNG2_9BIVA|nr:hypothetical protein CHS0354_036490 [Potamilus streckersoni]
MRFLIGSTRNQADVYRWRKLSSLQIEQMKIMGSNSSSNVRPVKIEQSDKNLSTDRKKSDGSKKSAEHSPTAEAEQTVQSQAAFQADEGTKNEKIKELEKQLIESESQRLDLEDQVQVLEERLEEFHTNNAVQQQSTNLDETLKAKDQYISKLEQEKETIEEEFKKLKGKHRKKVKTLTMQLSEYKQEVNFQNMELTEEIKNLKKENSRLKGKAPKENHEEIKSMSEERDVSTETSERMTLILEMSSQLSEQEQKIKSLEDQLVEKDHIIEELRRKMRSSLGGNAIKEYSVTKNKSEERKMIHVDSAESRHKVDYSVHHPQNSISSVKKMEEDEAEIEEESLNKLSSLLKDYKPGKPNLRMSEDSLELRQLIEEDQQGRTFSGASRDSGIGSAGNRTENKLTFPAPKSDINKTLSHVFSDESGLSDSDIEKGFLPTSKVSSAPAKMQALRAASRSSSNAIGQNVNDFEDSEEELFPSLTPKGPRSKKKMSQLKKRIGRNNDLSFGHLPSVAFAEQQQG